MTMMTQPSHPAGSAEHLRDPMSRVTLSRSSSGDSFVLEEKKSADDNDKEYMVSNDTGSKEVTSKEEIALKYRNMVSTEPGSRFVPEAGRYRLYVSRACPNSHLALLIRALRGLESAIPVCYVQRHPRDDDYLKRNWMIISTMEDYSHDSFASLKSEDSSNSEFHIVREMYERQGDHASNTIPLLYDTVRRTIVNNDTTDICYMLNICFNQYSKNPELDLLPKDDELVQSGLEEWLYPLLNLQPSNIPPYLYSYGSRALDLALNRVTYILRQQRYLTSPNYIHETDLKLFVTLIRYDQVYAKYLSKPPRVLQSPVLLDYCRDIYQRSGVADTISMNEIQAHFFGGHRMSTTVSEHGTGGLEEWLKMPHRRHCM